MFRTIQELLAAIGRRDPEALRFWERMQVDPDLGLRLGDERQMELDLSPAPPPGERGGYLGLGRSQEELLQAEREARENFIQSQRQLEELRAQRTAGPAPRPQQRQLFPMSVADPSVQPPRATPIPPPVDERAAGQQQLFSTPAPFRLEPQAQPVTGGFRYAAQPRLIAEPPAPRVELPQARVREPGDMSPPPRRYKTMDDFDDALDADKVLARRVAIELSPTLVRQSLIDNFRRAEKENSPELYARALKAVADFRAAMPRADIPSGRVTLSGADASGSSVNMGGMPGTTRPVVGQSGISIRDSSKAGEAQRWSRAAGVSGQSDTVYDTVGFAEIEEIAVQTASRMKITDMIPETYKQESVQTLIREVSAAAESAEAAVKPSVREVRARLVERTRNLKSARAINRFYDDVKAAVEAGDLNRFDAEELRKNAEMANTRIVREIFGARTFPTGVQIARQVSESGGQRVAGLSVSNDPVEAMYAAVITSRSREELMQVRDFYNKMGFETEEIATLNNALARQLARLELDDTQLQSFFGYTEWAYTPKGRIERHTPGVRGMERFSEVPQETQLPIGIRSVIRGENIRNKMINTMRRRKMWESDAAAAERGNLRVPGFEGFDPKAARARWDSIQRQIADMEEYGIGSRGDIENMRAERDEVGRMLNLYEEAATRSYGQSLSQKIDDALYEDDARRLEVEPLEGVTSRDKYVDESESDFLLRMLGKDDQGRVRGTVQRDASGMVIGGRPRTGQIQMAIRPEDFDNLEIALESSISGNRISEAFANQIMDALDRQRLSVEGSAVWRGRPETLDPTPFRGIEPANPQDVGPVAITPKGQGAQDYESRTRFNVETSDVTISVANYFDSGGEFLTRNYAGLADKEFLTSYVFSPEMADDVDHIVSRLNDIYLNLGDKPLVINGAGNSITNMPPGVKQGDVNAYIYRLLEAIISHPERQFEILGIKTGGQSGADIAWVHAARQLGMPSRISPAYGQYGGIKAIFGEPFGYKGSATGYLKEAQYREAMGLTASDPFTHAYKMSEEGFSGDTPLY